MLHHDRRFKLKWHLVVVYGLAQPEGKKTQFSTAPANLCSKYKGVCMIGGDFKFIKKTNEKNKPCVLSKWSHLFNSIRY